MFLLNGSCSILKFISFMQFYRPLQADLQAKLASESRSWRTPCLELALKVQHNVSLGSQMIDLHSVNY